MMGKTWVDEDMVAAVRTARGRGVKTALLSNSWGRHDYPLELEEMFDALVISARVGLRKPQPEIYDLACNEIGLSPEQCVFIDDFRHNIEAAEAMGIAGILHRDTQETVGKLEELLDVELV